MNEQLEQSEPVVGKRWFSVIVPSAHVEGGGARTGDHANYVYATNVIDALDRLKRMRGWKRNGPRNFFPEISELSDEEVKKLKEAIENTPNVNISQAKKSGFYGRRER